MSAYKKFTVCLIVVVLVLTTGCALFSDQPISQLISNPAPKAMPTATASLANPMADSEVAKLQSENATLRAQLDEDTATEAPASTPEPTATATPEPTCPIVYITNVPFEVESNMDVGDPYMRSIVYAEDVTGTNFVAIIEPGYNLDFESAKITGKYMMTTASLKEVACHATVMSEVRLYVGPGEALEGWTKEFPSGWKMDVTQYTDEAIQTPGATWTPFNVELGGNHVYGERANIVVCQLWDGKNAKHVYHVIVEAGFSVSSPALQGTCWTVVGGDANNVYARATQMVDEVKERDDNPVVDMIFVGDSKNLPNGWEKDLLLGWKTQ